MEELIDVIKEHKTGGEVFGKAQITLYDIAENNTDAMHVEGFELGKQQMVQCYYA